MPIDLPPTAAIENTVNDTVTAVMDDPVHAFEDVHVGVHAAAHVVVGAEHADVCVS
jgi:hypothetical protein